MSDGCFILKIARNIKALQFYWFCTIILELKFVRPFKRGNVLKPFCLRIRKKIENGVIVTNTAGTSPCSVSESRSILSLLVLLLLVLSMTGCGKMIAYSARPLFDDINRSFMQQRDVVLAEKGIPAFLLFLDGMIEHSPRDKFLLLSGAEAYSSYAAAFVGDRDPERNRILTERARDYAFRAFSLHNREFEKAKDRPYPEFVTSLPSFTKKDVPYLYYAAVCWAGWINAHSESMDAIADLPKVQGLVQRVIELDEGYFYGASHTFMGVLLSIRPPSLGGKTEEARRHFERAIELGQGRFLPAYVMYAEHYAKPLYKEKLFFDLLHKVLNSPVDDVPELVLVNTMAKQQAEKLIDDARREEYFK